MLVLVSRVSEWTSYWCTFHLGINCLQSSLLLPGQVQANFLVVWHDSPNSANGELAAGILPGEKLPPFFHRKEKLLEPIFGVGEARL